MAARKKNVLLSYVGSTDDPTRVTYGSILALADKRFRDEMNRNPELSADLIRKINSVDYEFDKLVLFYTGDDRSATWIKNVKEKLEEADKEVIPVNLQIDDPLDYEELYSKTVDAFGRIKNCDQEKYYASISSGTPTMHICWFYMTMSKHLPLTLLRVRNPAEVKGKQNYVEIVEPFVARNQRFDFNVSPRFKVDEITFSQAMKACNVMAGGEKLKAIYRNAYRSEEKLKETFKNEKQNETDKSSRRDSVLILGESGVGKEELAKFIHKCSDRSSIPIVSVNCAAIAETLLESELFGHEKGAFTGAISKRVGLFKKADKGTIFLDEIGEMSPHLQAKLLRALQEKMIRPVGSNVEIPVDVRVIAATNVDIEQKIKDKAFREDLYYRLALYQYTLPPLRAVQEEIQPLAEFFVEKLGKQTSMKKKLNDSALTKLKEHDWPGNIRELRNITEKAFAMSDHNAMLEHNNIDADDIDLSSTKIKTSLDDEIYKFVVKMIPSKVNLDVLKNTLYEKLFAALDTYKSKNGMTQEKLAESLGKTAQNYAMLKKSYLSSD